MSDIVERLRHTSGFRQIGWAELDEAADEIEALRELLRRCRSERDELVDDLYGRIRELQENGERLREIADEAVRTQQDMIEAVAGPLRAEIIRLRDELASKSAPGIDASARCVDPVAWMTRESAYRLQRGGNSKGAVPVHCAQSATADIPLYAAAMRQAPCKRR